MAQLAIRDDLIAARYDGMPVGPGLAYSFETQESYPVDAGNPLLRDLSPFTLRVIVPSLLGADLGVDVNMIGRANAAVQSQEAASNAVRTAFGISTVSGSGQAAVRLASLQQIVSAGQVVSGATTDTERSVFVDATTAADIAYQVERMLQTPPLTLLVNPREMSINYGVIQNYNDRTRLGKVFQRWGESQPTISFSGSTGGFVAAMNPSKFSGNTNETTVPSGLQFAAKRESAAFQNFVALYQFYRNNGYIYDTIGRTQAHLMIGAIAIDYDQWTYVGHIESFEVSYTEASQHRVEWSMEFVVEAMYDNADAVVSVQPMIAPTPSPSYPSRSSQTSTTRPDASSRSYVSVSGSPAIAETPLALLGTFGPGGG